MRFSDIPDNFGDTDSGRLFKPTFVERCRRVAPERSVDDLWSELWADFERTYPYATEMTRLGEIRDWFLFKSK